MPCSRVSFCMTLSDLTPYSVHDASHGLFVTAELLYVMVLCTGALSWYCLYGNLRQTSIVPTICQVLSEISSQLQFTYVLTFLSAEVKNQTVFSLVNVCQVIGTSLKYTSTLAWCWALGYSPSICSVCFHCYSWSHSVAVHSQHLSVAAKLRVHSNISTNHISMAELSRYV